jgi:hypothetical protein
MQQGNSKATVNQFPLKKKDFTAVTTEIPVE